LAAILFEMLAGEVYQPPRLLSQAACKLGPFFDNVLAKALAIEAIDRYQNVAAFIEAVEIANAEAERAEGAVQQRRAGQAVKLARSYLKRENYNLDQALVLAEEAMEIYPRYHEAQGLRAEIRFKQ